MMPVRSRPQRDVRPKPGYDQDYSFKTRDYSSREFARSRRFGDDPTDDSRTMSYVSSPLQMPVVGSRRTFSPYRASQRYSNGFLESDEEEQERSPVRSTRRREPRVYRNPYIEEDDDDDFLVPTYVPRRSNERVNTYRPNPRFSSRVVEEEDEEDYESNHPPRRQGKYQQKSRQQTSRRQGQEYGYKVESPTDESYREKARQEFNEVADDFSDDHISDEEVNMEMQQLIQRQQRRRMRDREEAPKQAEEEQVDNRPRYRKRSPQSEMLSTDMGYIIPASRRREDPADENDDDALRRMAGYIAKRKEFAVEDEEEMQHLKNSGYQYRILGNTYPLVTSAAAEKCMEREKLSKAPMFDMKIRSHVSWEKMNVKFMCKVRGHPEPTVTWYHNMVPIATSAKEPGRFKITSQFGVHCLELNRITLEDSGTYRVSAQNHKGEISCYGTLLVRRYDGSRHFDRHSATFTNTKRQAVDFPDVQNLDIPDDRTRAHEEWKRKLRSLEDDIGKMVKDENLGKEEISVKSESTTNDIAAEKDVSVIATEVTENDADEKEPAVISSVVAEIISSDDVTSTTQVISSINESKQAKPKPRVTFSDSISYEGDPENNTDEEKRITSSTSINVSQTNGEVEESLVDSSSPSNLTTSTDKDATQKGQDRFLVAINVQMKKPNKIAEVLSPTKKETFEF